MMLYVFYVLSLYKGQTFLVQISVRRNVHETEQEISSGSRLSTIDVRFYRVFLFTALNLTFF